jgi:hypothetical protein
MLIVLGFSALFACVVVASNIEIPSIDFDFDDEEEREVESKCWKQFKE